MVQGGSPVRTSLLVLNFIIYRYGPLSIEYRMFLANMHCLRVANAASVLNGVVITSASLTPGELSALQTHLLYI